MRVLILFIFLFFGCTVKGQRIINLNIFTTKNAVTIKFTLTPGFDCGGYEVLRSVDSINFVQVCDYVGICGITGANEDFSCMDDVPVLNKINHYKIVLNNTRETSDLQSIYVSEPLKSPAIVYPNPLYSFDDPLTLKISNALSINVEASLYDQFGSLLQKLDLDAPGDTVVLESTSLNNGLYFLSLKDGAKIYTCKFIVFR